MKDSGVEWIGKIPEHWEVRRLKSITSKIGSGGNREGFTAFFLKNFILPIPPKDEQQNIIKYLSEVDLRLEYAKQNFQKQISLLQERKQIIINDVVTGKVKVV